MHFDLRKPCANCPFRSDVRFPLRRAREIADALERSTFACHKTVDYSNGEARETEQTRHCAGALIMRVHMDDFGQMMRIAYRLGLFDPTKLDMSSPVYEDEDAFIAGTSS